MQVDLENAWRVPVSVFKLLFVHFFAAGIQKHNVSSGRNGAYHCIGYEKCGNLVA